MKERPRARVLLVESERYFLEMLVMHLEANFDVAIRTVASDDEAIAAIGGQQSFDLIVTAASDANAKLLRYLSTNDITTPTVVFSGDASAWQTGGSMHFVTKPQVLELVHVVTPILRQAQVG